MWVYVSLVSSLPCISFLYFTALGFVVWVFCFFVCLFVLKPKYKPWNFLFKTRLVIHSGFFFPFPRVTLKNRRKEEDCNFLFFLTKPTYTFMKCNWLFPPDPMEYFKDNRWVRYGRLLKSFPIIQQKIEQVPDLLIVTPFLRQLFLTWTSSNTRSRDREHRLCQSWVVSLGNHCVL